MCLLFCCVHCIAEPLLQWRRPVYLATLHVVVCILCDFCSWSAGVQYECACHDHFPLLSVLFQALLLLESTKYTNFWRSAHLQLLSAYIVYFQCVQISVCGIHRWNTGHWPNSLFRGVGLFIFLFWETDQKYVCAWSSVKANWQGLWLNYQFTFANKNISIHVHNCPFQWIHIKSFGKDSALNSVQEPDCQHCIPETNLHITNADLNTLHTYPIYATTTVTDFYYYSYYNVIVELQFSCAT